MQTFEWQPECTRPEDLVVPVRVDRADKGGLTRGAARGKGWRQCAAGWYVPVHADENVVEQRILEQSMRLPPHGGVTGWAALRWYGAAYFDGLLDDGRTRLPVPLVLGGGERRIRADPLRCQLSQDQFAPTERVVIDGLPVATVQRALFDEMRRCSSDRDAVVAFDMAAAAGLISRALMWQYVDQRPAWTGVPRVRRALALASEDSRSPQESRMRLVWQVDAGLPEPLCNKPVFGLDGSLLGYPDLFDPVAGLVGEYDGADHLRKDRRRHDKARERVLRDHGLEYLSLVRGDLSDRDGVAVQMLRVRARAPFTPPEQRRWTLEPPPWFTPPLSLDEKLLRSGAAAGLTHT